MSLSRPRLRKLIIFSEMIPEPWIMNLGVTEDIFTTPKDLLYVVNVAKKGSSTTQDDRPISHIDFPGMQIQWSEGVDLQGQPITVILITDELSNTAQAAIEGLAKMIARADDAESLTNIIMTELDSVLLYLMLQPSTATDPGTISSSYIGYDMGKVDGRKLFIETLRWSNEFEEFCEEIGVAESNLRRIFTSIDQAPRPFTELKALSNIPDEKLFVLIKYLITAGVLTLLIPF